MKLTKEELINGAIFLLQMVGVGLILIGILKV